MASAWDEALATLTSAWDVALSDLIGEDDPEPPDAQVQEVVLKESREASKGQVPKVPAEVQSTLSTASNTLRCPLRTVFQEVLSYINYPDKITFEDVHSEIPLIAKFFVSPTHKLHASKEALSSLIGVPAHKLEPHLALVSSTLLQLDRHYRVQIEEALDHGHLDLVLYLDLARYDETPMKVRHELLSSNVSDDAFAGSGTTTAGASGASVGASPATLTSTAVSVAKMFSSEGRYCLLVRGTDTTEAGPAKERYYLIKGSTLTWNQILGAGTAALMAKALQETRAVSSNAEHFFWKTRVCTTDEASSNILCEKILESHRPATWSLLHLPCNAHKAARAMSRSFELVSEHVSGMVNFALSLQVGASMHDFRLALSAVIAHKPLVLLKGALPQEVSEHQDFVLHTFGSTGTRLAERNFLFKSICRGDWRRSDRLELYVPPGLEVDLAEQRRLMEKALLMTIAQRNFATFPKHRWLGADAALDQVALAFAVHNLGAEAFLVMCQALQSKKPAATLLAPHPEAAEISRPTTEPTEPVLQPIADEADPLASSTSAKHSLVREHDDSDEDPDAQAAPEWTSNALSNARTRRKAAAWISSAPFANLIMQKYPGEALTSKDALMSLRVIGEHSKVETVQLEWGHGRVHRLISSVRTQTHTPHVSYINSQWVCQKHSRHLSGWNILSQTLSRPRGRKRKAGKAKAARSKKVRGWGGAFRAFISLHHKGQRGKVDFKEASVAFRSARAQNSQEYQEAVSRGSLATSRQRAGQDWVWLQAPTSEAEGDESESGQARGQSTWHGRLATHASAHTGGCNGASGEVASRLGGHAH